MRQMMVIVLFNAIDLGSQEVTTVNWQIDQMDPSFVAAGHSLA